MPIPIRISTGNIRTDLEEFRMPIQESMGRLFRQFEEDLLIFADRFKTRRVYCVQYSIDHCNDNIFRMDTYYKFFTFDDRALAFELAKRCRGRVQIYNFAYLINNSLEWVEHVPSPNQYEAIKLWKTFNTCDVCHREDQCVDARVYHKLVRVCKSCIAKYCQFTLNKEHK